MDENAVLHKFIDLIQFKNNYQQQSSGIAPQDMYVLERIAFHSAIQIRDLSKNYSIPPSTLTGILDRLEWSGYIRRIRKSDDRRTVDLEMTEQGKAVIQRHIHEDKLFASNLFHEIPEEKRPSFLGLMDMMLSNVKKEDLFYENRRKQDESN